MWSSSLTVINFYIYYIYNALFVLLSFILIEINTIQNYVNDCHSYNMGDVTVKVLKMDFGLCVLI